MRKKRMENLIRIIIIAEFCVAIFFWMKHNKVILAADIQRSSDYKIESKGTLLVEKEKTVLDLNMNVPKSMNPAVCSNDNLENEKKLALEEAEKTRQEEIIRRRELIKIAEASKPRVVKVSCRESNYGHPSKSDNKGKHVDEDCCPDPDEWPKPGCIYDAKGYSIMLKGSRK